MVRIVKLSVEGQTIADIFGQRALLCSHNPVGSPNEGEWRQLTYTAQIINKSFILVNLIRYKMYNRFN